MYNVQVLLSTYNGEKYIKEQLDSILNQQQVQLSILIRDDGSTDATIPILEEYINNNSNIKLIKGSNKGACASFFQLFREASVGYNYYALADQDDYWYPDKLINACKKLSEYTDDKPLLYCCEADITNADLDTSAKGHHSFPTKKPSFGNALIENIARGGGVVFNPTLLNMVRIEAPTDCYMHDWWLYLVSTCFGHTIHDNKAYYKYRQHQNNVLGASTSFMDNMRRRLSQSKTNKGHVSNQAVAFGKLYKIPAKKRIQLDVITGYRKSFKQRIRGMSGKYLYRQSKYDNIIFRLLFLTNHL